jgi:hypothetical protein
LPRGKVVGGIGDKPPRPRQGHRRRWAKLSGVNLKNLSCPVCGSRNITKIVRFNKDGEPRENALCLECNSTSLIAKIRHLSLWSGNFSVKIKNQLCLINGSTIVFESGVVVNKILDRYLINILGETAFLTFGTRLKPINPPFPLSLLK